MVEEVALMTSGGTAALTMLLAGCLALACGGAVSSSARDAAPDSTEDAKGARPDSHPSVHDASPDSRSRGDEAGMDAGADVAEVNPCAGFASPLGRPCQTTNEECYPPGAIEAGCTPCVACFSHLCTSCGK